MRLNELIRASEKLNEKSLSRVYSHMKDHDTGTLTAFRYAKDCGDGDVDLVDIITEVNFALGSVIPDDCQFIRGDVPTGTPGYGDPPYFTEPDGVINVLDVMVLIDMALDRQDCCTYYYTGGIY